MATSCALVRRANALLRDLSLPQPQLDTDEDDGPVHQQGLIYYVNSAACSIRTWAKPFSLHIGPVRSDEDPFQNLETRADIFEVDIEFLFLHYFRQVVDRVGARYISQQRFRRMSGKSWVPDGIIVPTALPSTGGGRETLGRRDLRTVDAEVHHAPVVIIEAKAKFSNPSMRRAALAKAQLRINRMLWQIFSRRPEAQSANDLVVGIIVLGPEFQARVYHRASEVGEAKILATETAFKQDLSTREGFQAALQFGSRLGAWAATVSMPL